MPFQPPSLFVWIGIPGLSIVVAGFLIFGFWRAAPEGRRGDAALRAALGVTGYFAVSGLLAASGLLASGAMPPPMMPMMAVLFVVTLLVALGPAGARLAQALPLWALVGVQGFRFPLELVLRQAARDGTMPVEMSFEGRNFDIVTGATALVLGAVLYRKRVSDAWVLAWNVLGAALLFNIVSVAIAALPFIHAFGRDNVNEWVLHFPFVWLPAVLVQAALFGHVIVFRRLRTGASVGEHFTAEQRRGRLQT